MVHVGHPQGQGVGGAAALGGEVPLEAAGACAVVDEVELGEAGAAGGPRAEGRDGGRGADWAQGRAEGGVG